jgi:hypothetical protein
MKFRIIRDYDEFQPQVWHTVDNIHHYWTDIGKYCCYTIDEAKKVCADYKRMIEDKVVEEFEL